MALIETEDLVQCEPLMDLMPMEMIQKFLSFLDTSDLYHASLACKRFMKATNALKYCDRIKLNLVESYYSEFLVPLSFFKDCERAYSTISLSTVQTDYDSEDFWIAKGENVREIHFKNGILRKEEFINVVKYTPWLEVLKIEGNNLFKTWEIIKFGFERKQKFYDCYHVSLARNNFMSEDIFEYLMYMTPQVEELDLSNCFSNLSPTARNSMLDYILDFLRSNRIRIKLLNFSNTVTDDLFLTKLSEIEGLHLKNLSLTYNGTAKNTNFGFVCLIRAQPQLENLDLTASPGITDCVLTEIANYMPNLKKLTLKKCYNLTDHGVREITKLLQLESLEVSNCNFVTDDGLMNGLVYGKPKKNLKELYLGLLANISENIIFRLAYACESLISLDLSGSSHAVTDNALQMVFKQMRLLRHLNLDSCCKLTDYGFTGLHADGKRYFSISNLKGLQTLRCGGLYKVTDLSLTDSFELMELKEVFFSRCHVSLGFLLQTCNDEMFPFQISEIGLKSLVKNCRSLETLDLSECKLTDAAVKIVAQGLPR